MRPYFDPEYENFNQRINPPRVCIDNNTCRDCTLVKVDSMNKNGILLEVVQVLSDLDLTILKAYITSDGGWFMDVFHVLDKQGQKVTDEKTIQHIEKALGPGSNIPGATKGSNSPGRSVGMHSIGDHTAIELKGPDRTGLLSEIFAVLAELQCNVMAAEVWTHRTRVACVVIGKTCDPAADDGTAVTVEHCEEKDYSVVNVRCRDRPKLLFDIVCTLTDMQYVVFHAAVTSEGIYGIQELYIRRKDGRTLLKDEAEKVTKCLEAAISRRVSEGFTLELCGRDRVGLLSDVTRVLREHGLTVTRADVTTVGEQAVNVFYVRDASGQPVDMKTIEGLRGQVGQTVMLNVKKVPADKAPERTAGSMAKTSFFSFGGLFAKLGA
uniref:ACT domain-containing protein ACR n=1 Tax=Aegilops tauschii TaxID=37682 RepID=M8B513_AEGTA